MSEETAKQEVVKILQELRDLEARAEQCLLELGWTNEYQHGLTIWRKPNHSVEPNCWTALNVERSCTIDNHTFSVVFSEPNRIRINQDEEWAYDIEPCCCDGEDCRGWKDNSQECAYIDPLIIEGLGLVRRKL